MPTDITREQMVAFLDLMAEQYRPYAEQGIEWAIHRQKCCWAILAALEHKWPSVSKMPDGWWLHLTGKDGKMADIYLGPEHGPIVESVLSDNETGIEVEAVLELKKDHPGVADAESVYLVSMAALAERVEEKGGVVTEDHRTKIATFAEAMGEMDYTDIIKTIYRILEMFGIIDNEPIREAEVAGKEGR